MPKPIIPLWAATNATAAANAPIPANFIPTFFMRTFLFLRPAAFFNDQLSSASPGPTRNFSRV
jgi:hypothetical protein